MRNRVTLLSVLVVLGLAAACAPPPPDEDAVLVVDSVWARYPFLRQHLLAQEHRFTELPPGLDEHGNPIHMPASVDASFSTNGTRVTITWDVSIPANARNEHNRWMAQSHAALVGAGALSYIKFGYEAKPPSWAGDSRSFHHCLAHWVVVDNAVQQMLSTIDFCEAPRRDLAWALFTS